MVILLAEEPVGFFVLHRCGETYDFTDNDNAICGYPINSAAVISLEEMDACSKRLNHSPWKCQRL